MVFKFFREGYLGSWKIFIAFLWPSFDTFNTGKIDINCSNFFSIQKYFELTGYFNTIWQLKGLHIFECSYRYFSKLNTKVEVFTYSETFWCESITRNVRHKIQIRFVQVIILDGLNQDLEQKLLVSFHVNINFFVISVTVNLSSKKMKTFRKD